ncbi:MAG: GGDEF domain-containing protein [Eubacteriales bacterium]
MNKKHLKLYLASVLLAFIAGMAVLINVIVLLKINVIEIFTNAILSSLLMFLCLMILGGLCLYIFKNIVERRDINNGKLKPEQEKEFDNLTQILTFDYFVNQIRNLEKPFSLIMLDIDCFRSINEKYGSVIGDLVLKVVAKAIKENVRNTDMIARYQGDGFAIILKNCPETNVVEIMGRIRQVIMKNDNLTDKNIKISASIGIYFVTEGESDDTMFRNAVEALKIAKENDSANKVVLIKKDIA